MPSHQSSSKSEYCSERKSAEMSDSDEYIQEEEDKQQEEKDRSNWTQKIKDKLGKAKVEEDSCIYKVPIKHRKANENAYSPRVVSIGPLHRRDPDLVASMRQYKWRYMVSFLQQTKDPKDSHKFLEKCLQTIYDSEKEVRQCYAGSVKFCKNKLAQIMLLDGCFILELFLRHYAKNPGKHDPIFKSSWMITALQHDLALLENQIPFFILEGLYQVVRPFVKINGCESPPSVAGLALMFFPRFSLKPIPKENQHKLGIDFKHLLDLLHKFYFLPVPVHHDHEVSIKLDFNMELADPDSKNKWGFNCSAKELLDSGIRLIGSSEDQLLNITFSNGVISIPQLVMDESASSVIRNLIALEQCSLSNMHGVTSYAFLMKSLIRSSADRELLEQHGIINHKWIGDHERMIEGLVDGVVMKDFYFVGLCNEVNEYTGRYWFRRYMKRHYRTYFSSAWSKIVFIAGILAFILTSLQTYYTINPP